MPLGNGDVTLPKRGKGRLGQVARLQRKVEALEAELAPPEKAEESIKDHSHSEKRVAIQYLVSRVLAEANSLEEAGASILEGIGANFDWHAGAVWLVDRGVERLRCIAFWHAPEESVSKFRGVSEEMTFERGVGLPGRTWASGKAEWICDITQDGNFPRAPYALQDGLLSGVASPIRIAQDTVGVIELFAREIRSTDPDMLELMSAIGNQMGQLIVRKHREHQQTVLYRLTDRLHRATTPGEVYDSALDTILEALGCQRASILLFDDSGVMRFVGWRGLSEAYRAAVEGHSPWQRETPDPQPMYINDIEQADIPDSLKTVVKGEGIHALAFIPLVVNGRLIGKFMSYYDAPHVFTREEVDVALTVGRQLGCGIEQKRAAEKLRESEARLLMELADSKLLQSISAEIISEQNEESLFEKLMDSAVAMVHSDFASIQMLYPDRGKGGELRLLAHRGFSPEAAQAWEWVGRDSQSSCGEALRTGKRVIASDLRQCGFLGSEGLATYLRAGIHAVQSTPLVSRTGQLVGMISTHWRKPHQPSERELRLFDILVRQAADIIERKRAEERLRKRGERLQLLSETLGQLISARDPETIVQELFPKVAAHLGVDTYFNFMVDEAGTGLKLHSCAGIPEETVKEIGELPFGRAICGTVAQTREPIHATDIQNSNYEKAALVRGFGIQCYACSPLIVGERLLGTLSFASRTRKAFDEDEIQFLRIISQHTAIALDRLKSAERLRASEQRFKTMADTAPAMLWISEPDGRCSFLSHGWFEFTGQKEQEALGLGWLEAVHPDDRQAARRAFLEANARHEPFGLDYRLRRADAEYRWVSDMGRPRFGPSGEFLGYIGSIVDMHERKRAEEALRERENQLRVITDATPALISYIDAETRYRFANRQYEIWFGHSQDGVLGRTMMEVLGESAMERLQPHVEAVLRGETVHFEMQADYRDGGTRWIDAQYVPDVTPDGGVRGFFVLVVDVTERKRTEMADRLLGAIVESSDDAILSKDLNGMIQSWNRGAEKIFGYTAAEIIGKPITMLMPPERVGEEPGIMERIRNGEHIEHFETVRRRKDGTLIDISLTISPIKDMNGTVIGASKVARDITERVRAKERLEQTVLARTASLREAIAQMEEFSYTVSHDLRAPLRGMQVYAEALLEDFEPSLPAEASRYLNRIAVNARQLDKMILDVLTFSRIARAELRLEPVNVDRLVRHIVEQYPGMQPPQAEIDLKPLHDVFGHEPSLTQALSNLLNNAVKFVQPGVKPKVSVWSESQDGRVRIWVVDNGIGVAPKYHHRLFGMFERVHADLKYEGTGVGLAIVRKAVERMGGKVGVESDGISGSRFWIELRTVDSK